MRTTIETGRAPAAIGPYAQAVRAGELVFCSGQIALDPDTMQLVPGGIEAETARALRNLEAVFEAAGGGWEHVVRTTIYLVDMNDFAVVNRIYAAHVGAARPARATVQVAALPRGAAVEIDAVLHLESTGAGA